MLQDNDLAQTPSESAGQIEPPAPGTEDQAKMSVAIGKYHIMTKLCYRTKNANTVGPQY